MKHLQLAILGIAWAFSQGALAHTDEYLDTLASPHGGQLRMAGSHHFELVVTAGEAAVYLTDHAGVKLSSQGVKGNATVLAKGKKTSIMLAPAGDNLMTGRGKFSLSPDMKVVVSLTLPGGMTEQARFEPMKKHKEETHEGQH